jgi:hypothetical protein
MGIFLAGRTVTINEFYTHATTNTLRLDVITAMSAIEVLPNSHQEKCGWPK